MKLKLYNLLAIMSFIVVSLQASSQEYEQLVNLESNLAIDNQSVEFKDSFEGEGNLLKCADLLNNPSQDRLENIDRILVIARHLDKSKPKDKDVYRYVSSLEEKYKSQLRPEWSQDWCCRRPTVDDTVVLSAMTSFQKSIYRLVEKNRLACELKNSKIRKLNQVVPYAEIVPLGQSIDRVEPSAPLENTTK